MLRNTISTGNTGLGESNLSVPSGSTAGLAAGVFHFFGWQFPAPNPNLALNLNPNLNLNLNPTGSLVRAGEEGDEERD
jgi:hypothetical protein